MRSKERILAAVHFSEADRVPMNFHGNDFVLERLRHELHAGSQLELLQLLGSDVVDLRGTVDPVYCGPIPFSRKLPGQLKESFWGWRQEQKEGACGVEEMYVDFPLSHAETLEELEQHHWPSPDWFDFSNFGERLEPWSDFAVMASGASVWQHPTFLRGIEPLMMDLAGEPEMAEYVMDRFTEFYLDFFDRMLTAARGQIDILRMADDLGTQRGLLFSPEMFRAFIKPRIARFVDLAHHHGAKLMFHSCGAIVPLIEDLIDIGVDILDPLQAAADGMDPQLLKKQYGSRICLHGGICTQFLLPNATPQAVKEEVERRIEIFGKGGGYILSPCHVLQMDVPTANVLAMRDVGLTHRYEGKQ